MVNGGVEGNDKGRREAEQEREYVKGDGKVEGAGERESLERNVAGSLENAAINI